jgi:hypothetical protein
MFNFHLFVVFSPEKIGSFACFGVAMEVWQANVPMRGGHYSVRAALCITFGYKALPE